MTHNNKNQDEILAEKGDPQAQFRVGVSYLENSENLQDLRKALSYLRKSAIQSNALAQYTLGVMHERGKGVDPDVVISLNAILSPTAAMYVLDVCGESEVISPRE